MKTKIKEIFTSIQGEGPYIGYKQLFVRFCGCNLNCRYCDTDFSPKDAREYSTEELIDICKKNLDCHSVSLTGGEPLLNIEFLKEFIPQSPLPVYLETNGTLYENLKKVIENITYIASDIKLPSCTEMTEKWDIHDKFFDIAKNKILFAKAVFDEKIRENEIKNLSNLCSKYDIELILQPKMTGLTSSVSSEFISSVLNRFEYRKVRVIPQVHKFLGVE